MKKNSTIQGKYKVIDKAIDKGDIELLREAVGSLCYICRDFSDGEFDLVLQYIQSKGIDIMDKYDDGSLISFKQTEYSEHDFAVAVGALKKNFCVERIDDVKKIGKKLYSKNVDDEKDKQLPNALSHSSSTPWTKVIVVGGVVAVVVIGAIIYIAMKQIK